MQYRLLLLCALSNTFSLGRSNPIASPEAPLTPRGSYKGVGCDNIMINKADTDYAVGAFYAQCKDATQSIFKYDGDTVMFYCQWHPYVSIGALFAGSADRRV